MAQLSKVNRKAIHSEVVSDRIKHRLEDRVRGARVELERAREELRFYLASKAAIRVITNKWTAGEWRDAKDGSKNDRG